MAVNKSGELEFKLPANDVLRIFTETFKDDDYEVEIKDEDPEKKEVLINAISSKMLRKYKVTATITPKDDGKSSRVKWSLESEKNPDYIHDDPHSSINTESQTVEFHRKSPAEDLFNALMEALKDDDEVEIEAEDRENMETTITLICTGLIETFKATIVVTPTDGDGSHVKCNVVFKHANDVIEGPFLSIVATVYFVKIFQEKFLD